MSDRIEVVLDGENLCPVCGAQPYWEVTEFASYPGTVWRCLNNHVWKLIGEIISSERCPE